MLIRKTVNYRSTKGDGKKSNKKNKGYKRANSPEISLRESLIEFIYKFSYLDPVKQLTIFQTFKMEFTAKLFLITPRVIEL